MPDKERHGDHHATCPYCGWEHEGCWDWEYSADTRECGRCGRQFAWERIVVAEYNTRPMRACPVCGEVNEVNSRGEMRWHMRYGVDPVRPCEGKGQVGVEQEDKTDE